MGEPQESTHVGTQGKCSKLLRTAPPVKYPKSPNTARAIVLAALLSPGEDFRTSLMFPPGAVGLHTVMRALVRRYKWPIIRRDLACDAGWITTWALPQDIIESALAGAGRGWLVGVRVARGLPL